MKYGTLYLKKKQQSARNLRYSNVSFVRNAKYDTDLFIYNRFLYEKL